MTRAHGIETSALPYGASTVWLVSRVPSTSESFYVRNDPNNDSVIVFVHGVTGNRRSTWTSDRTGRFWPDLLTQDPTFNGTNVFVYGYDSRRNCSGVG